MQLVVASYDVVFPAVDEGAPDVEDNCEWDSSGMLARYANGGDK